MILVFERTLRLVNPAANEIEDSVNIAEHVLRAGCILHVSDEAQEETLLL